MKKLPILVILGLVTALIVLAVVLLNHNDLEQAGLREKKLVYFKIEEYRKEAVVQPVSDLLKEKDQTNQSTPRLAQKETTSRQEKEPVEEKVVPEEKEYTVIRLRDLSVDRGSDHPDEEEYSEGCRGDC